MAQQRHGLGVPACRQIVGCEKMTRKPVLVVIGIAIAICIIMLLVVGGNSSSISRLKQSVIHQTREALQSENDTSGIHLSIRTDKACYLPNEAVQMWVELFNSSDEPVTVLKLFDVDRDNAYQGMSTLVNGNWDERMFLILEVTLPQEDDYVTLYPNELVGTYFPDFWDLTVSYDSLAGVPVQAYDLQVEYHNLIPGIQKDLVVLFDENDAEFLFEPNNAWMGYLQSNVVSIEVVRSLKDCP